MQKDNHCDGGDVHHGQSEESDDDHNVLLGRSVALLSSHNVNILNTKQIILRYKNYSPIVIITPIVKCHSKSRDYSNERLYVWKF